MPKPKKPLTDQSNNPLHGIKLADILESLEKELGWEQLGNQHIITILAYNY
jgi:uncharacterized protein (DUF2132 family)